MSFQSWVQAPMTAQVDGNSLTGVTPTSIIPAAAKFTLLANALEIGSVLRITAAGRLSNLASTPGTLTLDVRFGATVVFNGGTMQMSTTAHSNLPWWWDVLLTVRAIGASANLMGVSKFHSQAINISGADPTTSHSFLMAPNSAPAVGSNFDTTASQQVDIFATFSSSSASDSITLHQYVLENLN